jgi:hypothetical protein
LINAGVDCRRVLAAIAVQVMAFYCTRLSFNLTNPLIFGLFCWFLYARLLASALHLSIAIRVVESL